jgi:hypothetical protein
MHFDILSGLLTINTHRRWSLPLRTHPVAWYQVLDEFSATRLSVAELSRQCMAKVIQMKLKQFWDPETQYVISISSCMCQVFEHSLILWKFQDIHAIGAGLNGPTPGVLWQIDGPLGAAGDPCQNTYQLKYGPPRFGNTPWHQLRLRHLRCQSGQGVISGFIISWWNSHQLLFNHGLNHQRPRHLLFPPSNFHSVHERLHREF